MDDLFMYIIVFLMMLGLGAIGITVYKEYKVEQEIIKNSSEYTKFENCEQIQYYYYCK